MRRILAIVLALVVLAVGAALFFIPARAPAPTPSRTEEMPALSVASSTIAEETPDYTIRAVYPQFGAAAMDRRVSADIRAGVDALKAQARQDQPAAQQLQPYEYYATFEQPYIGDDIVSVKLLTQIYTGGAHGMPEIFGENFDRATGRSLTLDETLALTGKSLTEVATEAKQQLERELGSSILDITGADPKPENYRAFYITKDHVVFIFQPYQVAPYAAGAPEVAIARIR